eukprot:CAMPEP_0119121250 /NCGR_PEP_ID=MMETSP1310-20130426/1974_1 /TAXON_ID=464262 /ORGANISM="Genus nov. species nov., Strain RCC2339" /LENGTH=481 /DNA_ID=CAMNT_0007110809 /DNA_START=135 /DNA_END=1577 /DNA_ORIENTATION=+
MNRCFGHNGVVGKMGRRFQNVFHTKSGGRRDYGNMIQYGFHQYPSSKNPPEYLETTYKTKERALESNSRFPPLTERLAGAPDPSVEHPAPTTKVSTTVLPNGVQVMSREAFGPVTTFAIAVRAGTQYENQSFYGRAHLLERLIPCGSERISQKVITDFLESSGATVLPQATPEGIVYTSDCLRDDVPQMMEFMKESVRFPLVTEENFDYHRRLLYDHVEQLPSTTPPYMWVPEVANRHCFQGCPLSNEFTLMLHTLPDLTLDHVMDFHADHFHSGNIVITATGYDHAHLVRLVEDMFGDMPRKEATPCPVQQYNGAGIVFEQVEPERGTSVCLSFEGVGVNDDRFPAMCVLYFLMGGGFAFSAGGPGKGMYSRLYANVLSRCHWIKTLMALPMGYRHTGLFSIFGETDHGQIHAAAGIINDSLSDLYGVLQDLPDEELVRAKNFFKGTYVSSLESRVRSCSDMAFSALMDSVTDPVEWLVW